MNLPQLPEELKERKISTGNIREFANAWIENNDWEKYKEFKKQRILQSDMFYLTDRGYSNYSDPKDLIEFLKDCDEYDYDVFDQDDDEYEIRFKKFKVEQVRETKKDVVNKIWNEWSFQWNSWVNEQIIADLQKKQDEDDYKRYLELKTKYEGK